MTDFQSIPITDAASAERLVGGVELVQGADTLFFQAMHAMPVIVEKGSFDDMVLSDPMTIALDGTETHVLVVTNGDYAGMSVSVAGRGQGMAAADLFPTIWVTEVNAPIRNFSNLIFSNGAGDPKAVWVIETTGLVELVCTNIGTDLVAGFTWMRVVAPSLRKRNSQIPYVTGQFMPAPVGNATTGHFVTDTALASISQFHSSVPITIQSVNIRFTNTVTAPKNFDLVLYGGGEGVEWFEGDLVDYAGAFAVIEFRTTPTVRQYQAYASGTTSVANAGNLGIITDGGNDIGSIVCGIVAREAINATTDLLVQIGVLT